MRDHARLSWLPTPFRSVLLLVVWLLLNNSVSAGHILLGTFLAISIPLFTFKYRTPQPLVLKPIRAFRQFLLVMYDVIVANVQVALLILGPNQRLRPGFVKVPLALSHDMPITILASCVSLTPGTVSADVLRETNSQGEVQYFLLIHVLDLGDEAELIRFIKQRYEAPLQEIFQC